MRRCKYMDAFILCGVARDAVRAFVVKNVKPRTQASVDLNQYRGSVTSRVWVQEVVAIIFRHWRHSNFVQVAPQATRKEPFLVLWCR